MTRKRTVRLRRLLAPFVILAMIFAGAYGLAGTATAAGPSTASAGGAAPAAVLPEVASGQAKKLGAYPAAQTLRVVIGLKTPHPVEEAAFLTSLQDESSPNFHKYLTQDEWTKRFGPSAADQKAVLDWASSKGLTIAKTYPNRLVVDLTGTAGQLESAFGVQLNTYSALGTTFFANDKTPVLPSSISSVVDSIGGLDSAHRMTNASGETPVTPDYSAGAVAAAAGSGGAAGSKTALKAAMTASAKKLAAAKAAGVTPNFTNGFYDPTDIYSSQAYDVNALYAQSHCCNPFHVSGGSPKETSIAVATIGAHNVGDYAAFHNQYSYLAYHYFEHNIDGTPSGMDGEGTMDFEWATAWSNSFGAVNDTASVNMYDGATNSQSTFTDEYNQMVTDNSARVMTTSWSCAEKSGPHFPCDTATRNTQHNIFSNMVGLGWSLVASSGDAGAFGDCQSLGVEFPASDPNVTAAGGSALTLFSGPTYGGETAWVGSTSPGSCTSNSGGSTGGCSIYYTAPSYQGTGLGCGNARAVPDFALNAYYGQNFYFNGALRGGGGTSIVAPEFSGFLAQKNSYGVYLGSICGLGSGQSPCAPLGMVNTSLYASARASFPHKPTYDITSGCNSNDIGTGYCAGAGYDLVTGWGSFNALQLAWAMNYHTIAEGGAPTVSFSGPTTGVYYNTTQTVSWTDSDTGGSYPASGIAGTTYGWDSITPDSTSEAQPGSGDSFYSGPAHVGSTSGALSTSGLSQGCHTLYVEAWDNMGISNKYGYGSVCIDTVAPSVTGPQPRVNPGVHIGVGGVPVQFTWSGSDATSGISSYTVLKKVDGGAFASVGTFTSPSATVNLPPNHTYQLEVRATDRAGNVSTTILGRSFKVNLVQEIAPTIVYTGAWTLQAVSGATGGNVKFSTLNGPTAKVSFNGFAIAWVSTKGSNRGGATVSIDGAAAVQVGTNATTLQPAVTVYTKGVTAGAHSMVVKNLGTAGHNRVDIDSFVVLQ